MILKRIQGAVDIAIEEIKKKLKEVETKEAIANIASVSSADETIGKLIAELWKRSEKDRL